MTDDDKKEVERWLENWLRGEEVEKRIRKVIGYVDTEKYLKHSEKWLDRWLFTMIGIAIGVAGLLILGGHH